MRETTIGQLLVDRSLPPAMRGRQRVLDKKGVGELFQELAERHPEQYREVAKALSDVGREAAYRTGAMSFGPEDLVVADASLKARASIKAALAKIYADKTIPADVRRKLVVDTVSKAKAALVDDIYREATAKGNPLAAQIASGMRGNNTNLASLIGFDGLYTDQRGDPIPVPVLSSYSEGLRPHEFFAGAFGARKGVIDTKLCASVDTPVRMADGTIRRIADVEPEEFVLGADRSGRVFPVRVIARHDNGIRDCWRYRFRVGQSQRFVEVDATADHKILAKLKLGKLGTTFGHRSIYTPTPIPLGNSRKDFCAVPSREWVDSGGIREPRALLLGILLGNGCVADSASSIQISCGDPTLIDDIQPYAAALGLHVKHSYNFAHILTELTDDKVPRKGKFRAGGVPFKQWLRDLDVLGKLAPQKAIPNEVWSWDQRSIQALIGALIATDGSVWGRIGKASGAFIRFTSSSRQLAMGFRDLLAVRFGIHTGDIAVTPKEKKQWANYDQHHVTISGRTQLERIRDQIYIPGVKGPWLAQLLDSLPPAPCNKCGDWSFREKEHLGDMPTCDLEVDHPDHLFVLANGLIISNSTQRAGYFSKQLHQATHRLVVTRGDTDEEEAGQFPRGLPVDVSDPANEGALLAHGVGMFPRNTLLSKRVLARIREQGVKKILVRSPSVGGPREGGVDARDLGLRERAGLAPRGDFVGISAGQSLGEKLTQGQLSSKHSGGVAGAAKSVSGFDYVNCLASGTPVRMADWSVKPIEQIVAGDWVLGADKAGNTFPVRVIDRSDNGLKDCHQTDFRIGKSRAFASLRSTLDHKVLATRRIIKTKDKKQEGCWTEPAAIRVGHRDSYPFCAYLAGAFDDGGCIDEPLALLIGLLLGDGCYTKSVTAPELACCDPTQIDEIRNYLASLGIRPVDSGNGTTYRLTQIEPKLGESHARGGRWATHPVKAWLQRQQMWGKYAHEKTIPTCVDDWSNASIADLIAGLVVTDGCAYQLSPSGRLAFYFCSTSRQMVEKVRTLLATRFGIYGSRVNRTPAEKTDGGNYDMYRFDIAAEDSVQRFCDSIRLIGVKRVKAEEWRHGTASLLSLDSRRANRVKQVPLGQLPTHDLCVDHPDHLFVLENGLVVSNSMIQAPKIFPGGAAHAQVDGHVDSIEPAPQGGTYIRVGGTRHYAPAGAEPKVAKGDRVEAGDVLSDGHPNPAEIVKHKGIGEGRRYFINAFVDAYRDSGMSAHRRNVELLARGLIDHVTFSDVHGDSLPGDVLSYAQVERDWRPRDGARTVPASSAVGEYLEAPVLHHAVGTRVTKGMLDELGEFGVKELLVHRDPPPFAPTMIRAMSNLENDPDWMTRHLGANIQRGLLDATHRGLSSDTDGTSYVPAVADRAGFGARGLTRAWRSDEIRPIDRDSDGFVFDGTPRERPVDPEDDDDD